MANIVELRRVVTIQGRTTGVKESTIDLKQLDRAMDGVTVSAEQTTRATLSEERALRTLQTRLDPTFRATEKLAAAERTLTTAQSQGLITLARKNELMALAATQTERLAVATRTAGAFGGLSASGLVGGLIGGAGIASLITLPHLIMDSVHAVGDLADAAIRAGVSAEKLQILRQALAQNGGEAETADAALSALNVRLGVLAQTGAGPAAVALKALHLDLSRIRDLSPDAKFDAIAKSLSQIQDTAVRAATATELFGKQAGPQLAALLGQGNQVLADTEERMRAIGILESNDMVAAGDKLDDKIQELTRRFAILSEGVAVKAVSAFDAMIEKNNELSDSFTDLINNPSWKTFSAFMGGAPGFRSFDLAGQQTTQRPSTSGDRLSVASDAKSTVAALQAVIDKSKDFDVAFGDTASAVDDLRKGLEDLHKGARAVVDVTLPRLRPEIDNISGALANAQSSAEGFASALTTGLVGGQGLIGALGNAVSSLASRMGSMASNFISKLGGGGGLLGSIGSSILGGLGGGLVSGLVGSLGGVIGKLFGYDPAGDQATALRRQATRDAAKSAADAAAAAAASAAAAAAAEIEKQRAAREAALIAAQDNLRRAYEAQRDALLKTRDTALAFAASMSDLRDSLKLDKSVSTLSPIDLLAEAQRQFQTTASAAASGDEAARGRLAGTAQAYLSDARSFYASSPQYAAIFDQVDSTLADLGVAATDQADIAQQQLDALNRQVGGLIDINQSVMSVRDAIANLLHFQGVPGYASGGWVTGGMPGRDSVPAMLTPGEYVLTPSQARSFTGANDNGKSGDVVRALAVTTSAQIAAMREENAALRAAIKELQRTISVESRRPERPGKAA